MIHETPILRFDDVGKSFFGVPVLRNISFELREREILGLIGENGAGKSTLMNILGGVLPADAGRILFSGTPFTPRDPLEAHRCGVGFIHQELNLFPNLTVADNIGIANPPTLVRAGVRLLDRRKLRMQAERALTEVGLQVAPDTQLGRLSPGEMQLVEIAKALSGNARVVIFDEPTTSLTHRESERLFNLVTCLRDSGISIIYISHTLADIFRLCSRIVVLRDGEVVGEGSASGFDMDRLIALMVGRKLEQQYPERIGRPESTKVLEVRALSSPGALRDISFDLHRGEILGVSGLLGAGRTELCRALFGLDPQATGEVRIDGVQRQLRGPRDRIRNGLAFVTEDRRAEGLLMDADIDANLALVSLPTYSHRFSGLVDQPRLGAAVREASEKTGVRLNSPSGALVRSLSGGNQQRVVLAKWLVRQPKILILDEPTRGIDVGAKYEIYRIMDRLVLQGTSILFVSSAIEELIGVCDRILSMRAGEITGSFQRAGFEREKILHAALGDGAA